MNQNPEKKPEQTLPAPEAAVDPRHENITTYDSPAYAPRKKRFTDRKDGRRLRKLTSMNQAIPFIMKKRNDAQNHFEDVIDITEIEKFLEKKHAEGYTDMTLLHVILAAYVRVVAERPGINRFIAGQRVFARNNIQCVMVVKKEMTLESPDTVIKPIFDPRDTVTNIYKKFQLTVKEAISKNNDFDNTASAFNKIPRPILRFAVSLMHWLDYHGWLPQALIRVSPFHGSMIITSMGSLGIPAIYHHLYDFGNLPIFFSYGSIFSADAINRDGTREPHHFVTFKVVTDERICDGYYYASAFKRMKRYLQHPDALDLPPEKVVEDID